MAKKNRVKKRKPVICCFNIGYAKIERITSDLTFCSIKPKWNAVDCSMRDAKCR